MASIQQSYTELSMPPVAPGAAEPQISFSSFLPIFQGIVNRLYSLYKSGDTVSYHMNLLADQLEVLQYTSKEEMSFIFQSLEIPRISVIEVPGEDESDDGSESNSDNDENYEEDMYDFVDDRVGCAYCSGCRYCQDSNGYDGYDGYDN